MSTESDLALLKAINTPPEEQEDAVAIIIHGIWEGGMWKPPLDYLVIQSVVDRALAPYRKEIARLRACARQHAEHVREAGK